MAQESVTQQERVAVTSDFSGRLSTLGNEIAYRLCEIDSLVNSCGAILDGAEGVAESEELTALGYVLRTTRDRLKAHLNFMDTSFADLHGLIQEA